MKWVHIPPSFVLLTPLPCGISIYPTPPPILSGEEVPEYLYQIKDLIMRSLDVAKIKAME